jgi:hypothetical protein
MHYISILSTIVTAFFAGSVIERYRRRGGTHLLLWGAGLIFYGLGTLTESVLIFSDSRLAIKVWYLCGAVLTAAWLGQGTIHLLVRKRGIAPALTILLTIVSLVAMALVMSAPFKPGAPPYDTRLPVSGQYQGLLERNGLVIVLTIVLNSYGAIALVGGALYSAFIFWRKKVLADRMFGNILIAAGALMPTLGGSFIKAGLADWLYLSEFLGVVLMYAGFVRATASQPIRQVTESTVSGD